MTDSPRNEAPSDYIGCCGAYCRTCRAFVEESCKGCKLGYLDGRRDIARAKCRMKVCCISRGLAACGACPELDTCPTMAAFFNHAAYKYRRYREATDFIRRYGCAEFIRQAGTWSGAYGKLVPPQA